MKTSILLFTLLAASAFADAGVRDSGVQDAGALDSGTPVLTMAPVLVESTTSVREGDDAGVSIEVVTTTVTTTTTTAEPNVDIKFIVDAARSVHNAVKNKEWGRMIFLIITVLVIFCRKVLAPKVAFFRGKFGAPLLAFFWAGAGMLGTTWPAGTKLDAQDLWMALEAGMLAAGGWSLLKNTLEHFFPKDGSSNWATVIAAWVGVFVVPKAVVPDAVKPVA